MATNDHGSHAGKVVFVTGAASVIGRAINLRGAFLCMKYEVPLMLGQGAARS